MSKPKSLTNKRYILDAYESGDHKHVEVNITKHDKELTPKQLRTIAAWMMDTATWLEEKTKYRCSCCNLVKSNNNRVYAQWNQKKKEVVVICRKCNNAMKKAGFKGVQQYLYHITPCKYSDIENN